MNIDEMCKIYAWTLMNMPKIWNKHAHKYACIICQKHAKQYVKQYGINLKKLCQNMQKYANQYDKYTKQYAKYAIYAMNPADDAKNMQNITQPSRCTTTVLVHWAQCYSPSD
jgi:hypothetical protein